MGTNALPTAIKDDLSRGGMHSAAININTSNYSAVHVEQLWLFLRTSKRRPLRQIAARHSHLRQGRYGVTLSGDALPHKLDQGQRLRSPSDSLRSNTVTRPGRAGPQEGRPCQASLHPPSGSRLRRRGRHQPASWCSRNEHFNSAGRACWLGSGSGGLMR